MKSFTTTLLVLAMSVMVLVLVLMPKDRKHLAGIDQSKPSSTFEQRTNHFSMPTYDAGPIQGVESKFKVNQWNSYQV